MSYTHRLLRQTATWWEIKDVADTPYDMYGDPAFKSISPQLLQMSDGTGVRWENRTEKFIKPDGDEDHGRSVVWLRSVVAVGDYLYLGNSSSVNPETVNGADRVKYVEAVPDTKGRDILYKAIL